MYQYQKYILPENEWQRQRLGKITASSMSPLFGEAKRTMTTAEIVKAKAEGSKATTIVDHKLLTDGAITYLDEILAEIVTGRYDGDTFRSMEWGNKFEPEAIQWMMDHGRPGIEYFGKNNPKFFPYTNYSGGSPDALDVVKLTKSTFSQVVIEVKCPENPAIHLKYRKLKTNADLLDCSKVYYIQTQMNMLCVSLALGIPFSKMSALFVSFCPIMLYDSMKLFELSIEPDMGFLGRVGQVIEKSENYMKNELIDYNLK